MQDLRVFFASTRPKEVHMSPLPTIGKEHTMRPSPGHVYRTRTHSVRWPATTPATDAEPDAVEAVVDDPLSKVRAPLGYVRLPETSMRAKGRCS
jgi:hypothetical protein